MPPTEPENQGARSSTSGTADATILPAPASAKGRNRILRIAAWIVTAGLLAWLLWSIPFSQVIAATRAAAAWTVPVGILILVVIYLADSFAIWKTFGWFLARLSLAEIL